MAKLISIWRNIILRIQIKKIEKKLLLNIVCFRWFKLRIFFWGGMNLIFNKEGYISHPERSHLFYFRSLLDLSFEEEITPSRIQKTNSAIITSTFFVGIANSASYSLFRIEKRLMITPIYQGVPCSWLYNSFEQCYSPKVLERSANYPRLAPIGRK